MRRQTLSRWWQRSWHHVALVVWAFVCVAAYGSHRGQSWHFFDLGGRLLFCTAGASGPCGLHVYAAHPELQIGPLSLAVAGIAVLVGEDGPVAAEAAMAALGLVALAVVEREAVHRMRSTAVERLQRRVLLAGLVFVPAWVDLAVRFAHLDDVLALVFTAWAVQAVVHRRPVATGLLLACAALSKPWAVAFFPLALAMPRGRRLLAVCCAAVPVAVVATIFVVADPHTLRAGGFVIPNAASSSLRVLGVASAGTPAWDRPAQFLLGAALGVVAVLRGRWAAAVMVAAAVRIALDPGVYSYYTAAVLLGAVIWDTHARKGRTFPAWSWLTFLALFACRYVPLPADVLGVLRLAVCVVMVTAVLVSRPLGEQLLPTPTST